MKWLLLILPLYASAAPLDISDDGCPSQTIDIAGGQLVCVATQAPPPEPEPGPEPEPEPEPVGACAVGPNLNGYGPVINRQYFTDCGEATQLRAPLPTRTYWHIGGSGAQGSTYTMCLDVGSFDQDAWRYPGGNVTISTSDQVLLLRDTIDGSLTFTGQRVRLRTIGNGAISGGVVCGPGARNIEVNGSCVCN